MVERRKTKRYGIKGSTILVKEPNILSFLAQARGPYPLLNLSEGGCCFVTTREPKVGQEMALTISAPPVKNTISVRGKVVWTKKLMVDNLQGFRVGIAFSNLSDSNKRILKVVLDNAILDSVEVSTRLILKEIEKL